MVCFSGMRDQGTRKKQDNGKGGDEEPWIDGCLLMENGRILLMCSLITVSGLLEEESRATC
jgi:hypothetical protein